MNAVDLKALVIQTLTAWASHEEELRAADAALGDGDLGITVRSGSLAAVEAIRGVDGDVPAMLRAAGRAFATANPSTFAALVGGGVLAGASTMTQQPAYHQGDAHAFGVAVAERIQQRGGAEPGDKTILDALLPSLEVLSQPGQDTATLVATMAQTARARVAESAAWESQRGRAGWLGGRTVGHPDGGALAYALFLEEMSSHLGGSDD